jgi:hypothetical protein
METDVSTQVNQIEQAIASVVQQMEAVTADVAKKQGFVNAMQAALQALKS